MWYEKDKKSQNVSKKYFLKSQPSFEFLFGMGGIYSFMCTFFVFWKHLCRRNGG